MQPNIAIFGAAHCRLGESPLWDPDRQTLFWVDAVGPAVWSSDPSTGLQVKRATPDLVANVVLGAPGSLVVTLRHDIRRLDLATGDFTPIRAVPDIAAGLCMNDGKTDRAGRLVTGSMAYGPEPGRRAKLYRFEAGGPPQVLASDLEIANAICFSPAGDRLYYADSLRRVIWAHPYDTDTGLLGPRMDLIDTDPLESAPDGATVDVEGRLWVALVQSSQIACFRPDGRLDRLIETPIPLPSCPAFGGPHLDTLFVTTISDSGGRLRTDHPDGGRLMAITGLDAQGIAETRCQL